MKVVFFSFMMAQLLLGSWFSDQPQPLMSHIRSTYTFQRRGIAIGAPVTELIAHRCGVSGSVLLSTTTL